VAIIGKEAHDIAIAMDGIRQDGADDGIDAALLEQVAQRFSRRVPLDGNGPQQRQYAGMAMAARLIDRAFHPMKLGKVYAIVLLQMPAHPYRGAHGVERHADALALKILGRLDARAAI